MTARGFTFIEVLVAMLIFTMAALASINIVTGSVRATREAKEITQASWLLQNLMSQTESKLEGQGIDKACKEKEEGKFEAPNDRFRWKTECYKIDFHLSESAAKLQKELAAKAAGSDYDSSDKDREDPTLKLILSVASEYMTRSTREVHVEVSWLQGKTPRMLAATTHFVRYDQQPAMPGGLSGAAPAAGTPTGGTPPSGGGTPQ